MKHYRHGLICKDGDKWMYKVWDQDGQEVVGRADTKDQAFKIIKKLRESDQDLKQQLRGLQLHSVVINETFTEEN